MTSEPVGGVADRRWRLPAWQGVAIVVGVSIALMLPALAFGEMAREDAVTHSHWQDAFSALFWHGELWPRWLPTMNRGFGSPAYFIYPPVTQWVASLFVPILPSPGQAVLRVALSLTVALAAGGLGAWWWLERLTGQRAAGLFGALLYLLLPYHLFVDTYHRCAAAELWALGIAPLGFAGVLCKRSSWQRIAALVAATALLLLSNAPNALVVIPLIAAYAVVMGWARRDWRSVIEAAAAIALGAVIAAYYLATALTQTRFIVTSLLFSGKMTPTNWLIGRSGWPDPSYQPMVVALNLMHLAIAVGALWLIRRSDRGATAARSVAAAMAALVAGTFVLQTGPAHAFWSPANPFSRIQFPWRLLGVQMLAVAAAGATAFAAVARVRSWRLALLAVLPGLLLLNAALLAFEIRREDRRGNAPPPVASLMADTRDVVEYRLAPTERWEALFGHHMVAAASGGGTAAVVARGERRVVLDVVARSPSVLLLRQFTYTGWRYRIDGAGWRPAAIRGPLPAMTVPAGRHRIEAELAVMPAERLGAIVSLAGLIAFAAWLAFAVRRRDAPDR